VPVIDSSQFTIDALPHTTTRPVTELTGALKVSQDRMKRALEDKHEDCGRSRKKRATSGSSAQPVEIPFESLASGCQLAFNYWQQRQTLSPKDLRDLLLWTLVGRDGPPLFLRESDGGQLTVAPKRIVIVVLHGADPDVVTEFVQETRSRRAGFLQSCSSVPIRHLRDGASNQGSGWRYMDAVMVSESCLYPEQVALSASALLRNSSIAGVFQEYLLHFDFQASGWSDSFYFSASSDLSLVQSYNDLITKSSASSALGAGGGLAAVTERLALKQKDGDLIGQFQRRDGHSPDGAFLLRKCPSGVRHELVLAWYKQELQRLVAHPITKKDSRARSSSACSTYSEVLQEGSDGEDDDLVGLTFVLLPFAGAAAGSAEDDDGDDDLFLDLHQGFSRQSPPKERTALPVHTTTLRELFDRSRLALPSLVLRQATLNTMGFPEPEDKLPEGACYRDTASHSWKRLARSSATQIEAEKEEKEIEEEELEDGEEDDGGGEGGGGSGGGRARGGGFDALADSDSSDDDEDCGWSISSDNTWHRGGKAVDKMNGRKALVAIDCEMCLTGPGLELTRVTVVCPVQGVILDTLVKPPNEVVNHISDKSGITPALLADVTTTLLGDVHKQLSALVGPETIIVGHSLDSDLKALQLVHRRVIDSAVIYPHSRGLPYKQSLKSLSSRVLGKEIQSQEASSGHDSAEDALAALELVLRAAESICFPTAETSTRALQLPPRPMAQGDFDSGLCPLRDFLQEHCSSSQGSICMLGHSCPPLRTLHDHETYHFGYHQDRSTLVALQAPSETDQAASKLIQCGATLHSDPAACVSQALSDVSTVLSEASVGALWLDLPCRNSNHDQLIYDVNSDASGQEACGRELREIDQDMQRLFDALPASEESSYAESMLLVVSQGDLCEVTSLIAKRQAARWAARESNGAASVAVAVEGELRDSSKSLGPVRIANSKELLWSENDERDLAQAAANAIAGTVFIARK